VVAVKDKQAVAERGPGLGRGRGGPGAGKVRAAHVQVAKLGDHRVNPGKPRH